MLVEDDLKKIDGYDDYRISCLGDIYSTKRGPLKKLKPYLSNHGYLRVNLCKNGESKLFYIHELVAAAFIGSRPNGMQVRHLDSDKLNNHIANLAYGTQSDNEKDKVLSGLANIGSRHGMSKLNEVEVCEIKRLIAIGVIQRNIAKMFNVSESTICKVKYNQGWTHVKCPY